MGKVKLQMNYKLCQWETRKLFFVRKRCELNYLTEKCGSCLQLDGREKTLV